MASRQALSDRQATSELGVAGLTLSYNGTPHGDDFLRELRGRRGIEKYREMSQNDPIIGSILHAVAQTLKKSKLKVCPSNDTPEAKAEAEFVETVLHDMEGSWEDAVSEILTFLPFGFSIMETVYKRRDGPQYRDRKRYSKYRDGRFGLRKLAPRAQWSIDRFDINEFGDILGLWQDSYIANRTPYIPANKFLHFRTTAVNNDPAGIPIIRNAYRPYYYLTHIQEIEAIAIERELNGIPLFRVPAEYMAGEATESQRALLNQIKQIGRDVKFNEQGCIILPSNSWETSEGDPTDHKLIDFELVASQGTRNIDIDPVVKRYQADIARTILADFIMLGSNDRGSFALSKSKVDVFTKALQGYMDSITGTLNRQLLPRLWEINGLDFDLMPKIEADDVGGTDLNVLGRFLRASGLNEEVLTDFDLNKDIREKAGLPKPKEDAIDARTETPPLRQPQGS